MTTAHDRITEYKVSPPIESTCSICAAACTHGRRTFILNAVTGMEKGSHSVPSYSYSTPRMPVGTWDSDVITAWYRPREKPPVEYMSDTKLLFHPETMEPGRPYPLRVDDDWMVAVTRGEGDLQLYVFPVSESQ